MFLHVYYEDVAVAPEWRPKAFAFREVLRWIAPDGAVCAGCASGVVQ